jgi:DNA-binding CsgD family transcriptional regulator/tetratricopeptide (TPR) repeat protein
MTLLERDWVLDFLATSIEQAASGSGRIVFLSGEAGAGKTAVVRALLARRPAEATVLIGSCDSMPAPGQLWPLRDLAEHAGPALREPVLAGADRETLFRATLAELSSGPGPTVMVVEDVHWADDATLDLLRFLGRRIESTRGVVIATYRDDNTAQVQRLRLVLGDLATTPASHRIVLPPLSRDAVERLAHGRIEDVDALYARTGGNAFFVTEIVAAGNRCPAIVSDAITARYARLSPPARSVLDMAAVLGQSVELGTLRAVVADDENALSDSIESGALLFDGHSVRFRHALIRDAVLATMPPFPRTQAYGRAYDAFRSGALPADAALLAHLAEEAGRFEEVPEHARAAGNRAAELRSYREAALQYQRALKYSSSLSLCERSDLLCRLAGVTYYCGSGETDLDILRDLVDTYREAGDLPQLTDHLIWLAQVLYNEGHYTEARARADEAVKTAETLGDWSQRTSALGVQAHLRLIEGKTREALALLQPALVLAHECGDLRTAVQLMSAAGDALLEFDEVAGVAQLEAAIDLAREHHFDVEAADAMGTLGVHYTDRYQLDRADRAFQNAIAFTAEHDLDCWWRWARVGLSRLALARGDWTEAATLAASAIQVRSGCFTNQVNAYLTIVHIRARRGDPEVDAAIEAAEATCFEDPGPRLKTLIDTAKAEAAVLSGNNDRAQQIARPAFDRAIEHNLHWFAGELAHIIISAGGTIVPGCELPGPYGFEQSGDWEAAVRAWTELGAPYEAARALAMCSDEESLRQALATFEQLGAQPMAAAVMRRMRSLAIGSIPRGPRAATRSHPGGLTAREAEVLVQLGQGWTNGEIATRLFLSPRTIEHHVSAILLKLDAASRREAVDIATSRGILSA